MFFVMVNTANTYPLSPGSRSEAATRDRPTKSKKMAKKQ